jgi:hypothetical protein
MLDSRKSNNIVNYQQPMATSGLRTFEDLEVYRVARESRKGMYAISRQLPDFEKYEHASQIRRAAVPFTNNVVELTKTRLSPRTHQDPTSTSCNPLTL